MPNKHAAIKDLRKNKKRAKRNLKVKTHVKSLIKQLQALIKEGKKSEATELMIKLQKSADKAGKTSVFHRNKSARIVSKTAKAVNQMK